jgi:hypothetical protein
MVDKMVKRKRRNDGNELFNWRCGKCQAYKTVKDNSFFYLFRKPISFILTIIKFWCVQFPIVSAKDMLKLDRDKNGGVNCSEPIIRKVFKYMRSI